MNKRVMAALMALVFSAVADARGNEGTVIWRNLREGMSRSEANAVQPEKVIQLAPSCNAEIDLTYDSHGLKSVTLFPATGNSGDCVILVAKSLIAKYGKSHNVSNNQREYFLWNSNGVNVELVIERSILPWSITYRRDPDTNQSTIDKF